MREILFRGFYPDENGKEKVFVNGKWIKGTWVKGNHLYDEMAGKHYIVPFDNISESDKVGQDGCCYCVGFEVIPETVGQYTGLTDKHGTKIFEGDIARYGTTIHEVVFEQRNASAYYGLNYGPVETLPFGHYQDLRQIDVIGNIHDNPEILEV